MATIISSINVDFDRRERSNSIIGLPPIFFKTFLGNLTEPSLACTMAIIFISDSSLMDLIKEHRLYKDRLV